MRKWEENVEGERENEREREEWEGVGSPNNGQLFFQRKFPTLDHHRAATTTSTTTSAQMT